MWSFTCWISCLNHETFDISVEQATAVELTGTQGKKVLQGKVIYKVRSR